ncbi:hypothetical protein [Streptomyces sp. NPDC048392]|uniref:hypothetical protein n=1 Tax=Streptomyces sp. NPDC048392 TaxID=3365543 RepID=UPI003723AB13
MARSYDCQDCGATGEREYGGPLPKRCPGCRAAREREREKQRVRVRTYRPEGRASSALCAGGCGRMLYGSPTSLPPGKRTCRSCRSARREPTEA